MAGNPVGPRDDRSLGPDPNRVYQLRDVPNAQSVKPGEVSPTSFKKSTMGGKISTKIRKKKGR